MVDLLCFKVIGVAKSASLGDIPRYCFPFTSSLRHTTTRRE
jgi:hypothetical protein